MDRSIKDRVRKRGSGSAVVGCLMIVGVLVLLAGVGGVGWLMFVKLDGSPPRIALAEEIAYINADQPLTVRVTDSGSGLARAGIRLETAGPAR